VLTLVPELNLDCGLSSCGALLCVVLASGLAFVGCLLTALDLSECANVRIDDLPALTELTSLTSLALREQSAMNYQCGDPSALAVPVVSSSASHSLSSISSITRFARGSVA
jgi:hypothetical protein